MKGWMHLAAVGLVGLGVCLAVPAAAGAERQSVGGWSKADVKDQGVVAAAQFAVEAQRKVEAAAGRSGELVLVKVVEAEQQVVAGMNYRLTLQVKVGDRERTAKAVVWARVWLKDDERYKLTSWTFADAPPPSAKP